MMYGVVKAILKPILNAVFPVRTEGLHHLPGDGAVILASNHLSFCDSVFLPLVVPRKIVFLGKSDYFTDRSLKGRLTAWFVRQVGTLPVDRSGGAGSDVSLRLGLETLAAGSYLGIYPEGTRSPDGMLYRAKSGVARLAFESGAPVVPVAMINTGLVQPIGTRIPRRHPVIVKFGAPLFARDFFGVAAAPPSAGAHELSDEQRLSARAMADEIMRRIQGLSGQTYVDRYAADVKAERAAAPPTERPDQG
ncbi:1-acyl-sn-glycerol-3-phosphate acyltransferase [Micrococcales bacterium 31B]|nr:1-acyl-sn-glycerol-3-phosphate acyltransferase [Micrococcales bacterium 31B]